MQRRNAAPVAESESEQLPIDIPGAARVPKIRLINRLDIHPDPDQPREAADTGLRDSLARNGMLQPITVRRHPESSVAMAGREQWMIVDGERRWRSAEGVLNDLPCIVRNDMDSAARRLATQLEANTGKPLTPLEEARAYKQILDSEGGTIADLSLLLGRPKSTVSERLALLELGPWLSLIADGTLPITFAVKALFPVRGMADELHAKAIVEFREQFEVGVDPLTRDEFEHFVRYTYKQWMYPLTKTKSEWARQPLFNTSKHDAECGCGRVKFEIDHDSVRTCCANPDWWTPKHEAAEAEQQEKERAARKSAPANTGNSQKKLKLPKAAKEVKGNYDQAPKGVVQLTDANGRWATCKLHVADGFHPDDFVIDDTKLVYWHAHGLYPLVGTKDLAAVETARGKFEERLEAVTAVALREFSVVLKDLENTCAVSGPGCALLMSLFADNDTIAERVITLAPAIALELPEEIRALPSWERSRAVMDFMCQLNAEQASSVFTALLAVEASDMPDPVNARTDEAIRLRNEIHALDIPWTKPARKEAPSEEPLPMARLSEKTAPLPGIIGDDDEVDESRYAGGEASDVPSGGELWDEEEEEEELEGIDA